MSTEASRAAEHTKAARTTIIDKVEVAARKGARATWTELVGIWDETKKSNVWQLTLIGLVAVLLVVSGFVEVFVDGILG